MAEGPALGFAGLLRQLRTEARLTQEELAEAAGLSPRSVSDLERGINRTAHKNTAVLLAGALGLAEPLRVLEHLDLQGQLLLRADRPLGVTGTKEVGGEVEQPLTVLDRDSEDQMATLLLGRCLKRQGPRAGGTVGVGGADARFVGLERLKTIYEERAYWQLKAVVGGKE